jgi:hypothetical protein
MTRQRLLKIVGSSVNSRLSVHWWTLNNMILAITLASKTLSFYYPQRLLGSNYDLYRTQVVSKD